MSSFKIEFGIEIRVAKIVSFFQLLFFTGCVVQYLHFLIYTNVKMSEFSVCSLANVLGKCQVVLTFFDLYLLTVGSNENLPCQDVNLLALSV